MAPIAEDDARQAATGGVTTGCPAFEAGCPYINLTKAAADGAVDVPAKHADSLSPAVLETLKSCPAFRTPSKSSSEGSDEHPACPFRGVSEMKDVGEVMTKMPPSHSVNGSAANTVLIGTLKAVHAASQAERERLGGKPCPVFDGGCPFKQCRTSEDRPVVLELEARVWFDPQADAAEAASEPVPAAKAAEQAADEDVGDPARDIFLSKLLKMGTQDAHKAAESGSFVKRLLRGKVPPQEYRVFLVDLCCVYAALEDSLEAAAEEKQCQVVRALHHPTELTRLGSLQDDLKFWFRDEPGACAACAPSEAAQAYASRIRELVDTAPHLLVAHAYTRYLGDLSGGTVIRRSICRAMPVGKNGEGVRFFDFENVPDAKVFKQKYRDELDCLDVPPSVADELVQEANRAFEFNAGLFRHLDKLAGIEAPAPEPRPRVELPAGHPLVPEGAGNKCPFAAMAAEAREEENTERKAQQQAKKQGKEPKVKAAAAAMAAAAPEHQRLTCSWSTAVAVAALLVPVVSVALVSGGMILK